MAYTEKFRIFFPGVSDLKLGQIQVDRNLSTDLSQLYTIFFKDSLKIMKLIRSDKHVEVKYIQTDRNFPIRNFHQGEYKY